MADNENDYSDGPYGIKPEDQPTTIEVDKQLEQVKPGPVEDDGAKPEEQ